MRFQNGFNKYINSWCFLLYFFVCVCRNCRVLLAKMESKEEPEAEREATTEELADDTEVLFSMDNLSLVSTQDQVEISYNNHIKNVD